MHYLSRHLLLLAFLPFVTGCVQSWINGVQGQGLSSHNLAHVSFQQNTATMTEGGTAMLLVVLSQAQPVDTNVTLSWTSTNGDEATRFSALPNPLVIPAGSFNVSFILNTVDDNIYQGPGLYELTMSAGAVAVTANQIEITLNDNDTAPTIQFSAASQSVVENSGGGTATVHLSRASSRAISVGYAATDGTAAAGVNYTLTAGSLNFAPGQITKNLPFVLLDDGVATGNLTFQLDLATVTGTATLGATSTQTVTEVDSETYNLTINDVTVNEGSSATFTITTSQVAGVSQSVDYATVAGTAAAGVDYTITTGTATIPAGQTTVTVSVPTTHTAGVCDADRAFTLHLSNPVHALISTATGTATIQDIDNPSISLASNAATEGSPVAITATLSQACAGHAVTFNWSNTAGTARAGVDYATVTAQSATIAAGATTATLSTTTVANHYNLGAAKTFTVTISAPAGATLGTSTATGTINQTNTPPGNPTLSLKDPTTLLTTYARQVGVTATVGSDTTATLWCLSQTQTTQPAVGTSICTGGTGTSNGWLTARPASFNLSSGDSLKTVYLWVADANNNVSSGTVSAAITLDTSAPATPTSLVLTTPATSPNSSSTPTITVGTTAGGDVVTLYGDSSCASAASSAASATGSSVAVTASALTLGSYVFYARSVDAAQNASACSTASVAYTYDTTPLGTFAVSGVTGAGDTTFDAFLNGGVNPTISWGASSNATSYDVTVYQSDGTTVVCALQNTTATSYNFSSCSLTVGLTYKAKVTSKKPTGSSTSLDASNSPYSFLVNSPPTATSLTKRLVMLNGSITLDPITGSTCGVAGCTLSVQSAASGTYGTTTTNGSTITYTGNATGADSFSYVISDGRGGTASGTASINVMSATTWTGNAGTSAFATAGNWCGSLNAGKTACLGTGSAPGSSDIAIFDATCTTRCSASLGADTTLAGLQLNTGYLGTLTQGNHSLTINGNYQQAAGSFTGSASASYDVSVSNGNFTLTGGTFTATAGNLDISASSTLTVTISTPATFNANAGTFWLQLNENTINWNVTGGLTLNNYKATAGCNGTHVLSGSVTVNGLYSIDSGCGLTLNGGDFYAKGDVTATTTGGSGTSLVHIGGASSQTLTGSATGFFPDVQVESTGGTVTLAGTINSTNFKYASGTLNAGTSTLYISDTNRLSTFDPGSAVYNNVKWIGGCNSGLALASNLTLTGTLSFTGGCPATVSSTKTIYAKGDVTATNAGGAGSVKVLVNGSTNQTISGSGTANLPAFEIASTGGTVTFTGNLQPIAGFKYTSGTVDLSGLSKITFSDNGVPFLISPGSLSFNDVEIRDVCQNVFTLSGTLNVLGNLSMTACASEISGQIVVSGDAVLNSAGGTGLSVTFAGSSSSTVSALSAPTGNIVVNKTGGATLSLAGNLSFNQPGQTFSVVAGSVNMAGYNLTLNALSLNGNSITRGGGALTVATGSAPYGGTVNP